MTVHRYTSRARRRIPAAIATASLALTVLVVTSSTPAQAALPPQCVTSGSQVICTLSQGGTSSSMQLEIPADVSSIQIHAVGERGRPSTTTGSSNILVRGGSPSVVDASVPVMAGEIVTAALLQDGGAAGSSFGGIEAGAGGSSVTVSRGSDVVVQAAGGGGAGAAEPVYGSSSRWSEGGGGDWYGEDARDNDPSGSPAGGGVPGTDFEQGGLGGPGAQLFDCSGFVRFADGSTGSASSGGRGGDGEYGGGGGGGGRYGGGGGGAGGTGCEGFSYGAGGGGGLSVMPRNGTWSRSTTESRLVRITFWVGPRASHSPSAMSFGQVAVGSSSAVQTLTVTNTGSLPVTLGSGALGGTNPGSFRKAGDMCSNATLAPGAVCQVGLQFVPLTAAALSATFTLPDNSQANPHIVPLSGTGAAESTHSPSTISFGQVTVGINSAIERVTVTNTGSVPLKLGSGVIGGSNPGSFVKLSDSCSDLTVAPGASCRVDLQFRPVATGVLQATFTLPDNSLAGPHVVWLSGTGVRPVAVTSVSSLDFGAQEIGQPGAAQTVELKNTGTDPLVVSSTTFGRAHGSDFSTVFNTCTNATVAPGSSCSVAIRMTATGVGERVGSFTFTHNAAGGSSMVTLGGNGTPSADLAVRGVGSVYAGRDHLVTQTVAGPGKVAIYPIIVVNEDTSARSFRIALTKSGAPSTAQVWTTGFGAKQLTTDQSGKYITAVIQPKKAVAYNLRVSPTTTGQAISGVSVALFSEYEGQIESVRTETNTAAPLNGTSAFELFARQGSQMFVGGPVSGQTATGPALNVGSSAPFTMRLKNNGTSPQRIGLWLTDMDGCAGSFTVTVTAAGKAVTAAAFNGTYLTPLLAPTKFQDVFVTIKRVAAGCPSKTIRAQSLNNGVAVRTSYLLVNAAYNAATD